MSGKQKNTAMETSSSPDWSHQCTLYLLGELAGQSLTSFEQQLASSPELGEMLIAQAALIEEVSKIKIEPSTTRATMSGYRWKAIATMASLAACVAGALLSVQFHGQPAKPQSQVEQIPSEIQSGPRQVVDTSESESLLIAKVWVGDSGVAATETEIFDTVIEDALFEIEDESEAESAISWMTVAVAAENALLDGESNDG
ncbi:MAG: hypothetical protein GY904_28245 [Planctomycetaceae bacterium]|nr:hypothetical protein [Planctomycetaceae bacterium]